MSFCIMEGERYRIRTEEFEKAERQLSTKFICFKATMTVEEYHEYLEDLRIEATDYWFALTIEAKLSLREFGFISDVDAMGFRLRWVE